MSGAKSQVLVVGESSIFQEGSVRQSSFNVANCVAVETIREAEKELEAMNGGVVLAAEVLPDGRAYELMPAVEKDGGSLLVAVALSESNLWLPVVDLGKRVLGSRALNSQLLELELERLAVVGEVSAGRRLGAPARAHRDSVARRRILSRRAAQLPMRWERKISLDARHDPSEALLASVRVMQAQREEDRCEAGRFERAFERANQGTRRTA